MSHVSQSIKMNSSGEYELFAYIDTNKLGKQLSRGVIMYKKDCADQWNNIKKYMKSKMRTLLIVLKKIIRKIIRSIKTIIKKIKEGWNNDMSEMDKVWKRIVYIEQKVFGEEDAEGKGKDVDIKKYKKKIEGLEESIRKLNKCVENLNAQVKNLQNLDQKNQSLQKDIDDLREELEKKKQQLDEVTEQLEEKTENLQKLRDEKDSKEKKLGKNIEDLIIDKTRLEDEIKQKKDENQNLDNSYFKNSMGTYVPGILNDEGILKYKEIVKGTI